MLILARVVQTLGTLDLVTPHEIEGLFAADLAFLQDFYGVINFGNQQEYEELLAAQAAGAAADRGAGPGGRRDAGTRRPPAAAPTARMRAAADAAAARRGDPARAGLIADVALPGRRRSGRRSPTWPITCTGRWTICSTSSTWTGCGWCARWPG